MANKVNYQKMLEEILAAPSQSGKRLLLHSCCAPCSSYVLCYLAEYFEITVFYYNPNISHEEEYKKRVKEQMRLIAALNAERKRFPIHSIEGGYQPEDFYEIARGYEQEREGGERCLRCYELRLFATCQLAKEQGFDYFTTTLTISPLKNAEKLNEIGERLAARYEVAFLPSDFKKKNGYLKSIELSKKYDLYRQDFCGCIYSKLERERQKAEEAASSQPV